MAVLTLTDWAYGVYCGLGFGQIAVPRSRGWPAKERECFLRDGYKCMACGKTKAQVKLIAHHVWPFHLYPQLELVLSNLLTLCQPLGGGCHLKIGHTDKSGHRGWVYWNPDCIKDAAEQLRKLNESLTGRVA